jgi:hypothetical protein
MNAPTQGTLRAEAAEAINLVNDFALQTKCGDSGAAERTAEAVSGIVRRRPIMSGIVADHAMYLIETLGTNLGNGTNVGLANLMLRLHRESGEVIRGRLEDGDRKQIAGRRPEMPAAAVGNAGLGRNMHEGKMWR